MNLYIYATIYSYHILWNIFYKLILLTILFPLFSSAQSNYKPGYLVNMQGDTIKGYVDFKEWSTSPTKFNFKNAITGEASIYTADNAKAFGITGYEYYKLFNITVSQAKLDVSQLTQDVDTTSIAGTLFFKANNHRQQIKHV